MNIDTKSKPSFKSHYPCALKIEPILKDELDRLEEIKIIGKIASSKWAAPTFTEPKKDGRIRILTDFRELNKNIQRSKHPLPNIQDILNRRSNYQFFTKLDISMQYYCFNLDKESQQYCVMSTPFGLYKYLKATMGVSQSPDFAQSVMDELIIEFRKCVETFLDDVGIFTQTWSEHIHILSKVLTI